MLSFLFRFKLLILSLLLIGACTPKSHLHGQIPKPYQLERLVIGEATKNDLLTVLGSPTTISNFSSDVWYYMGARTEQWAFFETKILELKVHAFKFNEDDVLEELNVYDKESLQEISLSENETETSGNSITILQQLIGNFGRFNPKQE
ncbi:MAG: outer membrane protein assembly factor BamE [Pseudomonadota bacterium]